MKTSLDLNWDWLIAPGDDFNATRLIMGLYYGTYLSGRFSDYHPLTYQWNPKDVSLIAIDNQMDRWLDGYEGDYGESVHCEFNGCGKFSQYDGMDWTAYTVLIWEFIYEFFSDRVSYVDWVNGISTDSKGTELIFQRDELGLIIRSGIFHPELVGSAYATYSKFKAMGFHKYCELGFMRMMVELE